MRSICRTALLALLLTQPLLTSAALAQRVTPVPLISEGTVTALHNELSGSAARRTLEFLSQLNRPRGSRAFNIASVYIESELTRFGLTGVTAIEIPADGHTMYGTGFFASPRKTARRIPFQVFSQRS